MDESLHLIIGNQLSGEIPNASVGRPVGPPPPYESRGPQYGKLTICMVECEGLALVTIAINENGQDC